MSSVLNVNSSAIASISQADVHVSCDQTLHQYEQPKPLGALYIIAKSASATKSQHTRDCCWLTPAASPAVSPCTHWCSSQADQRSRSPTTIYITHHCAATSNDNNTPSHTVMNLPASVLHSGLQFPTPSSTGLVMYFTTETFNSQTYTKKSAPTQPNYHVNSCYAIFSAHKSGYPISSNIPDLTRPSVLWHCWLGVKKSIRPVKIERWGVGVVICLERGADCLHYRPADVTAFQNPIISCLI